MNKQKKQKPSEENEQQLVNYLRELELRVQSRLGRKCKIEEKGKRKTLTLSYENNDDLDELLSLICGKEFLDEY